MDPRQLRFMPRPPLTRSPTGSRQVGGPMDNVSSTPPASYFHSPVSGDMRTASHTDRFSPPIADSSHPERKKRPAGAPECMANRQIKKHVDESKRRLCDPSAHPPSEASNFGSFLPLWRSLGVAPRAPVCLQRSRLAVMRVLAPSYRAFPGHRTMGGTGCSPGTRSLRHERFRPPTRGSQFSMQAAAQDQQETVHWKRSPT
jgi:hypothetical protein